MTSGAGTLPAGGQPRAGGLRPTLWVLGWIALLGIVLPVVNAATGTTYRADGSPLTVGQGVQLTPRSGWGVDQRTVDSGQAMTFLKGATAMTVSVQPSTDPLPVLWEQLRDRVGRRAGIDRVGEPTTTATNAGVNGLRAPLAAPRGGGTAAVYSDGKTAVTAIAQGRDYRQQAADVTAMLQSLRFGVEEAEQ